MAAAAAAGDRDAPAAAQWLACPALVRPHALDRPPEPPRECERAPAYRRRREAVLEKSSAEASRMQKPKAAHATGDVKSEGLAINSA